MSFWPRTSISLLQRLEAPADPEAWESFLQIYRPAVYRFARRFGLQHADADDVCQRVMESVAVQMRRRPVDLSGSRFRSWMATVTRNVAVNLVTRDHRFTAAGRSSVDEMIRQASARESGSEDLWRQEERMALYRAAAARVRANCTEAVWQAFERTAVHGESPDRVSAALGISIGVVYASRSRVLRRIRSEVAQLQSEGITTDDDDQCRPEEPADG